MTSTRFRSAQRTLQVTWRSWV